MGETAAGTPQGNENGEKTSMPVHVVIVGAGPAGLLLAFYLLERGNKSFKVSLYESREDLRTTAKRELNARRYSLSLAYKGKMVCKPMPGLLEAIKEISRPLDQLHIHVGRYVGASAMRLDLVRARGGDRENRGGLNIDRANLCAVMLEKLLERHGDSGLLDVHFFKRCAGVDFRKHEASFEDVRENVEAEGSKGLSVDVIPGQDTQRTAFGVQLQTVPYNLIVGADGVNSMVRHTMALEPRGFDCSVIDQFTGFYILHVPRPPHISPSGLNIVPSCPDSASFRCVFYPNGHDGESLNLAIGWANNDPVRIRSQVRCDPYHHSDGRAVLVGDAAHATSPSIGQGCNSSMVDAAVLARLLLGEVVGEDDRLGLKEKRTSEKVADASGSGREAFFERLPRALERYSALQVREGHALVDLSESEGPLDKNVAFWHQLRTMALGVFSRFLPWFFPKPILAMVGSNMPFSEMRRIHAREVEKVLSSNAKLRAEWRRTQAQKTLSASV
ncbi:hypothetical protein KFL_000440120 [Klebsormidium nitens]|uniref:FAD-binding domain-containing protein n=1 Tax=Klebsormidium nitens TaxID=105231 RepID=A0A1Y1HN03_KLENI|nr:hypothetical protein KFL_000440120 [Klebsormidium nitens]|eukprot:GAQ80010.1 hypothetical protein KFL_000440120 [Klebsormidium nitens]